MLRRAADWLGAEDLLILCICAFTITIALGAGLFVTQDTWLALLSGRVISDSGLPSEDYFTVWTHGRDWVDQQWLGQLTMYGLWSVGDLQLLAATHILLVTGAFGGALALARRGGASTRATAAIGVLALEPTLAVSGNIRTQSFALVFFVVLLWILRADSTLATRQVFWVVPLLAVWTNVHGSVVLGAGFVGMAALASIVEADTTDRRGALQRGAVITGLSAAAVFASPYAPSLPAYYGDTLFSNDFRDYVAEWKSPDLSVVWAPFYALGGLTLFLLGRRASALSLFERFVLVITLAMGLMAVRNLAWFAIAAAMLLPAILSDRVPRKTDNTPTRRTWPVAAAAIAGTVAAFVGGLANLDQHVERRYPAKALTTISVAARGDHDLRIFAAPEFADWILWSHPQLAGRVLFDARFELLSSDELRDATRYLTQTGEGWRGAARGAGLSVLDPGDRPRGGLPDTARILLRTPGALSLYRSDSVAVVLHRAGVPGE